MHRTYQCYDPKTGRIFSTVTVSEDIAEHMQAQGEALIEGDGNDLEHFIDVSISPPKIRERPKQTTRQDKTHIKADGEDMMTLSGLPIPCNISINGTAFDVKDGLLEMTTLLPGDYVIRAEAFPFVDWEGKVTAL